ncbi:bifunctional biotin--[acetyl-CoA-carboxylase] ligase/biotin operon repressor BirA [Echinimonas agarilytica]|uniref:Bifunctional ligase/repressor BirA n=1 Tax=Echinimonas agarilytica TaxID=1215918 RepID=A0AA41W987_9GAMM|nr:bifunctional biotin--[acetyl-CoA-carboxylase] ligase/biotin operon repressor BirA [Echinimonas agarilytica]MCM2681455.1 bifunctional biotin--[acetyl-CoA-carboxylase] ligase/biotin operon repressor BirA [Echinimonas agarilytica]
MRKAAFETKRRLLVALRDDCFISGQELAEQFDISRAAISRHVKELEELGVDIYSVKGRGYKLAKPLDLIEAPALAALTGAYLPLGAELLLFPVIDSTNQHWMQQNHADLVSGSACFAECQTAGRGRRGRTWQSPFGASLYFSMWWQSQNNLSEMMGLSVAVGVALTRWMNRLGVNAKVKWPNDIYIEHKKVSGVLVELDAQSDGRGLAVVGIGLNVSMPSAAGALIDQAWTDLSSHLPIAMSRTELAAGLYQTILNCLEQFEQGGLQACIQDWDDYDEFAGQSVRLSMGQHDVEGICRGVDGHGALQVEVGGVVKSYFGGEISVRGCDNGAS